METGPEALADIRGEMEPAAIPFQRNAAFARAVGPESVNLHPFRICGFQLDLYLPGAGNASAFAPVAKQCARRIRKHGAFSLYFCQMRQKNTAGPLDIPSVKGYRKNSRWRTVD